MQPPRSPAKKVFHSIANVVYWMASAVFLVLCGLNIQGSLDSRELSELGFRGYAPDNLRTAAESLEVGLAVDLHGKDLPDLRNTRSWRELEDKLDGYATRLELMAEQRDKRNRMVSIGSLVAISITLVCVLMNLWRVTQGKKEEMEDSEFFRPGRERNPSGDSGH